MLVLVVLVFVHREYNKYFVYLAGQDFQTTCRLQQNEAKDLAPGLHQQQYQKSDIP